MGKTLSAKEVARRLAVVASCRTLKEAARELQMTEKGISAFMQRVNGTKRPRAPQPVRRKMPPNRQCMCCAKPFYSEGPHNRMCDPCRATAVSPYAANPGGHSGRRVQVGRP